MLFVMLAIRVSIVFPQQGKQTPGEAAHEDLLKKHFKRLQEWVTRCYVLLQKNPSVFCADILV